MSVFRAFKQTSPGPKSFESSIKRLIDKDIELTSLFFTLPELRLNRQFDKEMIIRAIIEDKVTCSFGDTLKRLQSINWSQSQTNLTLDSEKKSRMLTKCVELEDTDRFYGKLHLLQGQMEDIMRSRKKINCEELISNFSSKIDQIENLKF